MKTTTLEVYRLNSGGSEVEPPEQIDDCLAVAGRIDVERSGEEVRSVGSFERKEAAG
ncbi:hypothetical protein [Natrinema gelatinilyticum]|uniref:hypothetical protein n=1 Tax=Natrinema gelatinilyticum TaxID=2961571 RepID=UPI0020C52981|nr:hypothetical protein [Natrinema gelatinilyticum]